MNKIKLSDDQKRHLLSLNELGDVLLVQENGSRFSISETGEPYLKTQHEALLYFIQHMDSHMLELILDDNKKYQDFDKHTFIQKLNQVFEEYRESGDTFLNAYAGQCCSNSCSNFNCKGYSFVGNKSNQYMDLIFETKDHEVEDIYECYQFENQQKNLIKKGKVSIDSQEIPF
jgi:hypothetical protein